MDKIDKNLARLSEKEREWARQILKQISSQNFQGLDIKKLKGKNDVFRVRKGDIRIIYRVFLKKEVFVLSIERRSEKTYKN